MSFFVPSIDRFRPWRLIDRELDYFFAAGVYDTAGLVLGWHVVASW